MEKLKNKFAFISGGTSGIGLATAKDFIKNGARVIISGRHQGTVDETVATLGPRAHGIVCDHSKMTDIYQLGDRVRAITTKIDILFPNAGYGKFAPVAGVSEEMYDELFNVLTKGSFFTVQQLLPLLQDGGAIIFNTSIVTAYGSQNASVYSAAKSAVQSFIKTFAAELISRNIRVNGVSPGYTKTDIFNKTGLTADEVAGAKAYITPTLPLQRFADPVEVAKVVTFLASADASYIHAAEIVIDGGYTIIK